MAIHLSNAVAEFKSLDKLIKPGTPSVFRIPIKLVYEGTGTEEQVNTDYTEEDHTQYEKHLSVKEDDVKITKYVVGQNQNEGPEKVLMILGATGAGKTTLINSMINYLFGVTFEDDFRLQLISENSGKSQAHSQTKGITSYTIYKMTGFKLQYSLTIVDTPGYGDTEGLRRDKIITKQIKTFLSQSVDHGIDHLDGVGFVVQSASAHLTKTQEYIFDSILALFGKDVKKNIFIMVTFADAQRPPVLNVIDEAKISYDAYYTFNNSAIFANNTENKSFTELFWNLSNKSFEAFFTKFSKSQEVSLKWTREVLDQRIKLNVFVYAILRKLELGVAKLEELENDKKEKKKKAEVMANRIIIDDTRQDVKKRMKVVQGCLVKLDYIALRTNPLSEESYLEMSIASISEKEETKYGSLEHIKFYQEALQEAQIVSLAKGMKTNDPICSKYERLMNSKASKKKL